MMNNSLSPRLPDHTTINRIGKSNSGHSTNWGDRTYGSDE